MTAAQAHAAALRADPVRHEEAWRDANRAFLTARVAAVRLRLAAWLEAREKGTPAEGARWREAEAGSDAIRARMPAPPALERLAAAFSLSPFEESVVVAGAAVELDPAVGEMCARAAGDPACRMFTFALAMTVLPEAHWTAVTPEGPLRRWRLIEVSAGPVLTACGLRLDERVLHYLLGASQIDTRLAPLVSTPPEASLLPSEEAVVDAAAAVWRNAGDLARPLQIHGGEAAARIQMAAAIARRAGLDPALIEARALPAAQAELDSFLRLWEREAVLERRCLIVDCGDSEPGGQNVARGVAAGLNAPVVFAAPHPLRAPHDPVIGFEAPPAAAPEQLDCWKETLGAHADALEETVAQLAEQFRFSPCAIRLVWEETRAGRPGLPDPEAAAVLWDAARRHARGSLDELAQRLTATPDWDDLVLPETQKSILLQIAAQVRHRARVHQEWGFDAGGTRGLGLGVLFSGPPGTGKTLAAEVLAARLRLDLYRIDLSAVVSKYIGDTERNLRRVFDAAEHCGAILLFDEADALFGQRSDVKDSHDRYANIEVSYLLQRMEAYRGLAILTTNRKRALDDAFHRRLRFAVEFPFPDAAQRAEIWKRVFPRDTPVQDLNAARLAQMDVAGGNIRSIAMNAAFLAAADGSPVRMAHVLAAARAEYAKLDRPLTAVETGGWL